MNAELKKLLLPFYFGSVSEKERLLMEQQLLIDSEVLVEYLDLKRNLESAESFKPAPSVNLRAKLLQHPLFNRKKVWWWSLAAAAVVVLIILVNIKQPASQKGPAVTTSENLIDTNSELPVSSGVL